MLAHAIGGEASSPAYATTIEERKQRYRERACRKKYDAIEKHAKRSENVQGVLGRGSTGESPGTGKRRAVTTLRGEGARKYPDRR